MARHTQNVRNPPGGRGRREVKADLVSVGQSGEQSLKRIETAGDKASGGLKGLGRQAELLRTGIRALGGALVGGCDGRWPRGTDRPLDLGGPCDRQDRGQDRGRRRGPCGSCGLPPRRLASSSRPSTWRCSASPGGLPRRRRAPARRRTRSRRWASRCATRAATCAVARTCSATSPTRLPTSRIRRSGYGSP